MNTIWKACDHLGHGLLLEVAQKVAWVRKNEAAGRISYHKRFLSAEGCYSHRAMHAQGVRIKIAQKQFAGLERQEHAHSVVYVLNGALWVCAGGNGFGQTEPDLNTLLAASAPSCDHALPDVHHAVGEEEAVATTGEGCGAWVPPEFRMCAESLKGRTDLNLLRRDGKLYAQPFTAAPAIKTENGRCVQGAFFHMQEWKKRWEDGGRHIDQNAAFGAFRLSQDGIFPLALPGGGV